MQQAATAETDVRNHGRVIHRHPQQHVGSGPDPGISQAHPCGQGCDGIPQRFQHRAEEQIVFEAIAPAAAGNEFGLEACQIQSNGAAQKDVEVFKGNVSGVRQVQRVQYIEGGLPLTGVADALQIGVQIES